MRTQLPDVAGSADRVGWCLRDVLVGVFSKSANWRICFVTRIGFAQQVGLYPTKVCR